MKILKQTSFGLLQIGIAILLVVLLSYVLHIALSVPKIGMWGLAIWAFAHVVKFLWDDWRNIIKK